ncbi:MAG: bifunctional riboflavin kinase/FAD synthetase [Schleiferiaceae bacterium]|nr:bifunctional riboflavin kinase/FAD synthetase [Schleiferiaceae bacterium]MDR9441949.1 bifunctional riboflavin kinase/FAD synthetase [Schleiferiaceae bacterium]
MKVYYHLDDFEPLPRAVVTTGTFDGVHIGHRKILKQLNDAARREGGESVLLTFHPHPRMVLQPDIDLKLINTQAEKIALLKETGLDHLIIHPFTRAFSRTTSLAFVREILVNQIGAKRLVIGYDHHFGRNREGSFEHLKEYGPVYGFEVEEIAAQDVDEVTVSSTKIRRAIEAGDVATAQEYLGYPFPLSGQVSEGEKLGTELGYPTANLRLDEASKIVPANGVYAVRGRLPAHNGRELLGLCNIGIRPTFSGKFQTIEVHFLDFSGDLYGTQVALRFEERLRAEKRFDGREALVAQMQKDEAHARRIL